MSLSTWAERHAPAPPIVSSPSPWKEEKQREMGQVHGTLRSHAVVKKNGKLALESHLPPEVLEFDPNQSYMISYGIDLQTHPKFCQRSLTSIAGTDAEASTSMFRKIGE